MLFSDDDVTALRQAHDKIADQVEAILDVWYSFVGANLHLLHFFTRRSDGQPDATYLDRVRQRFGQWILNLTAANYDQAWLDYQYEIGLRHHRTKKNQTDQVATPEHIPLRYVLALTYPIAEYWGSRAHASSLAESCAAVGHPLEPALRP